MLELTGKDISELKDDELRTLVGMLCEAELRLYKLPISGVTWGGHQDAADGGIDVRVELEEKIKGNGFLPKSNIGIQVKKPDLSHQKIIEEMCPQNELRDVVKELIKKRGAYIIVCGNASTTDLTLRNRRAAMREAVNRFDKKKDLTVDYYDRDRLATWVRDHPSIVIWVRQKIGNPIDGWQTFKNWSKNNDDIDEEYLVDDNIRIFRGEENKEKGIPAIEGINLMRQQLSNLNSSIRFVGLSGVGKTRLLQALFDERIGENALNKYQVIYGDVGNSLNPDPVTFLQRLVSLRQPLILAVDNCPPKLHQKLTSICSSGGSQVKLITIEYDIKEDQPEETKVFRLEPISVALTQKILESQFSIGHINARNIAEFSGGNARIAFALAKTIRRGEPIGYLKDSELFDRLFLQRNQVDDSLMRSAEVCALVYSFDSQTKEGEDEEMKLLAGLAEKSKKELYRDISKLLKRDLVQQRSKWRAILPHAIANRLATRAMENIPIDELTTSFESSSERLLQSFAHRLSFLPKNTIAKEVAKNWLSEKGLLGTLSNLNNSEVKLLNYVALLSPEITLNAIERAIKENPLFPNESQLDNFSIIIGAIAYDEQLFERCVKILTHFYLSNITNVNVEHTESLMKTLFYIKYSRTNASLERRVSIVKELISSSSPNEIDLGISLLSSLLKSNDFRPYHLPIYFNRNFSDYGYYPKSNEEAVHWYSTILECCQFFILKDETIGFRIKMILANNIWNLWSLIGYSELYEKIEGIVKVASGKRMWINGWIAIRKKIRVSGEKMETEQLNRLVKLESDLAPSNLIDQVRVYGLTNDRDLTELLDINEKDNNERWDKLKDKAHELGTEVAKDKSVLKKLIPDLLVLNISAQYLSDFFIQGLTSGTTDYLKIWNDLKNGLDNVPEIDKSYYALKYFLKALSKIDSKVSTKILDDALTDDILLPIFPILQCAVEKDKKGWERIKKSLELKQIPIRWYGHLLNSNFDDDTYNNALSDILESLIAEEKGMEIAITILALNVFGRDIKISPPSNEKMRAFARKLLTKIEFDRKVFYLNNSGFKIARIIDGCFDNHYQQEGDILCKNIVKASLDLKISLSNYPEVINSLARKQSSCFLNRFFVNDEKFVDNYLVLFDEHFHSNIDPLSQIEENIILDWCKEKPLVRYSLIASIIKLVKKDESGKIVLNDLVLTILKNTPDVDGVLKNLAYSLRPYSWSESLVVILKERLPLLEYFKSHKNKIVQEWGRTQEKLIQQEIESIEQEQKVEYRNQDERFEY